MVEDFGVPETQVAAHVGLLASAFFLAQLLSSVLWGMASDKWGRRPCLLLGVVLSGAAMVQFGLASSFPLAVLGRVLAGGLSGNVGITKTYMGEVARGSRAARGFSVMGTVWGIGSILAPIVGGYLSQPTEKFPATFPPEGTPFLVQFPYFLPCMASTLVAAVAALLGFFFLPETHAFLSGATGPPRQFCGGACSRRAYAKLPDTEAAAPPGGAGGDVQPAGACGTGIPSVTAHAILCYAGVAMAQVLFDELMPVMAKFPVSKGGLGFQAAQVGLVLTIQGVVLVLYQLLLFPHMVAWLGTLRLFQMSAGGLVPVVLLWPFTTLAAEASSAQLWAVVSVLIGLKAIVMANLFTGVMLLINASVRQAVPLGTVNGVAQSASAGVRSVAPFLGGVLFSASHALHWRLHGLVAYLLPAMVMLAVAAGSLRLPSWLDEDQPSPRSGQVQPKSTATALSSEQAEGDVEIGLSAGDIELSAIGNSGFTAPSPGQRALPLSTCVEHRRST